SITIPKLSDAEQDNGGRYSFSLGDKNNRGAEHVVNDIRYTMEMHIVHRNKKYATLAEALDYVDGAAVLGFFFNLDEDESTGLTTICRHLHLIPEAGNEVSLNVTFSLASLIHGVDIDKFYTYKGSLTTPPCSRLLLGFISRFRQLSDSQEGALVDNYRQLQPLGNRRIFMRDGNTHHTQISKLVNEVDYKKWDWFH
ncbi:hypothetical protein DOY81_011864, partial [Sarcophaga bullata]